MINITMDACCQFGLITYNYNTLCEEFDVPSLLLAGSLLIPSLSNCYFWYQHLYTQKNQNPSVFKRKCIQANSLINTIQNSVIAAGTCLQYGLTCKYPITMTPLFMILTIPSSLNHTWISKQFEKKDKTI